MKTFLIVVATLAGSANIGCTSDSSTPHEMPPSDAGPQDSGAYGDAATPDCYMNPKTHLEIINACTDAQAVDKKPVLPLLQPDGSLPPL